MEIKLSYPLLVNARFMVCLLCFLMAGTPLAYGQSASSLEAIQQRYAGKWPKAMTYIKKKVIRRYGREDSSLQYHAYLYPRFARIDQGSLDDGNATVVHGDTTFRFSKFKKKSQGMTFSYFDDYMLGAIYFDGLAGMEQVLTTSKIDFNRRAKGVWEGRPVYVIGASSTDDRRSRQVWYDAKDLYPVRFIDGLSGNVLDTRYKMKKYGEIWFPESANEFVNNKQTGEVRYLHLSLNSELPEKLFDVKQFGSYHWAQDIAN